MSIFIRFLATENKIFRDELLAILTFKDKTRGKDLFESFENLILKLNISYNKIVSISIDGAPAMI